MGETSLISIGGSASLPYIRGHQSLRGPREDGGHDRPLRMDGRLYPREHSAEALQSLCYGISFPRGPVVRSQFSFTPNRLKGSNNSCLRACTSLYAERSNLRS